MVTGYHFGLASQEVDTYFAYETARFAGEGVFNPPPVNNRQTTTYAREVCGAEPVLMDPATQSIVDTPSKAIQRANRLVDERLELWVTGERR
jgi:hypothetical protein